MCSSPRVTPKNPEVGEGWHTLRDARGSHNQLRDGNDLRKCTVQFPLQQSAPREKSRREISLKENKTSTQEEATNIVNHI